MKIGYIRETYAEKRNIIDTINDKNYTYVHVSKYADIVYVIKKLFQFLKLKKFKQNDVAIYRNINPKCDILHTFNSVCSTKRNWVCSFESIVPRTDFTAPRPWENNLYNNKLDKYTKKCVKLILKDNCKGLIAISNNAYSLEKEMLEKTNIDIEDKKIILNKIKVIHPPQNIKITAEEYNMKFNDLNKQINFIFVGRDFFRKAGEELLKAFEKFENSYSFKLILISSLDYKDYITDTKKEERDIIYKSIQEKNWIEYHSYLDNEEVIKKMKIAHVGLLPTYADLYGFSVLEMQACGCPVITTNIRALTEINNEKCGWICKLPVTNHNVLLLNKKFKDIKKLLQEELEKILSTIFENREEIISKSKYSLERISREHNPCNFEKKVISVYKGDL